MDIQEKQALQKLINEMHDVTGMWSVEQMVTHVWQAAKSQAVPEGFVLMPLEIDDFDHPITKALEKGIVKDLSASVIYKAMIEAQDPAND